MTDCCELFYKCLHKKQMFWKEGRDHMKLPSPSVPFIWHIFFERFRNIVYKSLPLLRVSEHFTSLKDPSSFICNSLHRIQKELTLVLLPPEVMVTRGIIVREQTKISAMDFSQEKVALIHIILFFFYKNIDQRNVLTKYLVLPPTRDRVTNAVGKYRYSPWLCYFFFTKFIFSTKNSHQGFLSVWNIKRVPKLNLQCIAECYQLSPTSNWLHTRCISVEVLFCSCLLFDSIFVVKG